MPASFYHPRYQDYFFGPQHPFRPARQEMLLDLLDALGRTPDLREPPPATRRDVRRVHSEAFVEAVEAASEDGRAGGRFGLGTPDTPAFEGMDAATRRLAGGTLEAARHITRGEARVALQFGGGLHHAHRERASGFCVYDDLALAIEHLTGSGLRVAYLDIDVHHGDGVQHIFYDRADVLTISLHESGRTLFPGTGFPEEHGEGAGAGCALNVPLAPHTSDEEYLRAFEAVVPPALEAFEPDVLVAQCGADAHFKDPLAHLLLTTHAYERLFRRMKALAAKHTGGRLLATHGGGYNLDAAARVWALQHLIFTEQPLPDGALPDPWRERWRGRHDADPAPTLHDTDAPDVLQREKVETYNRRTVEQAVEGLVNGGS